MTTIIRSALLTYSDQQMFDIVNDVENYPLFLHNCVGAEILSQSPSEMVARLDLKKGPIKYSFATRNRLESPHRIGLNLQEGPFSSLEGEWVFKALTENACKVSLNLSFEFKSESLGLISASLFSSMADNLVDALAQRADVVYG